MTKEKMTRLVDRLAELKERVEEIDKEKLSIEAELQTEAETLLKNSKSKTVAFGGTGGNRVVVTKANSVKLSDDSEALPLEKIFGKGSPRFSGKVKYDVDAESKRALSALCSGEYLNGSIKELVESLDCDENVKQTLAKKIHGKKFDTDAKNFMAFTGMNEEEAFVNAYLASEITAYQVIKKILEETGRNEEDISNLIENVKNAVIVSTSTKITVQTSL